MRNRKYLLALLLILAMLLSACGGAATAPAEELAEVPEAAEEVVSEVIPDEPYEAVPYTLYPAPEGGYVGDVMPYVTEDAVAHFGARVIDSVDVGTHYLIVGEVEFAEVLSDKTPMTYAYYHQVKGGKTPPKASSYEPKGDEPAPAPVPASAPAQQEPAVEKAAKPRIGWRCMICGYVVEMDELPEDFTCPMCGMGRDMFERIEL